MKAKITLHIYAKSTKANATGRLPIYIRITVDGQRLEFSTKRFVENTKWEPELFKMKGNSEEACSLNSYLDLIKSKIFDIQMEHVHKNRPLSIEVLKNKLSGIEERARLLIPIFQGNSIVLQISFPPHSSFPFVPSGKYLLLRISTITHHPRQLEPTG